MPPYLGRGGGNALIKNLDLSRREPARAFGAELLHGARLVLRHSSGVSVSAQRPFTPC